MKKQVELIAMHRIVNELDRRTATIARKYGLTLPQFAVLEALYHKGDLSVGELKESVLSTDGTIPVVTRHLKQQGLIVGTTDSKDRRRTIMTLTDKGRALIAKVYPENEAMLDAIFGKWNHEERKAVLRLLSLLELD